MGVAQGQAAQCTPHSAAQAGHQLEDRVGQDLMAPLVDGSQDLAAQTAGVVVFVDDEQPAGLPDGCNEGLDIQRMNGPGIDNFGADSIPGQLF